jgi:peroxiredoxin Q/BCP
MAMKLSIGDKAPEFTLADPDGNRIGVRDFKGKKNLVVYFYPKDESYGCTKEACSFRDSYEDFREAGAEVIGISTDDAESHRSFASHHRLPVILLSDPGGTVAELYGAEKSLGILPGRITFVIDKEGIIRGIYSSQINYNKHIREALQVLKQMDRG